MSFFETSESGTAMHNSARKGVVGIAVVMHGNVVGECALAAHHSTEGHHSYTITGTAQSPNGFDPNEMLLDCMRQSLENERKVREASQSIPQEIDTEPGYFAASSFIQTHRPTLANAQICHITPKQIIFEWRPAGRDQAKLILKVAHGSSEFRCDSGGNTDFWRPIGLPFYFIAKFQE